MDQPKTPLKVTEMANKILNKIKKSANTIKDRFSNIDIKDYNTYKDNSVFKKALAGFMIVVIVGLGYTGYKVNEIRTRAFDVYLGEHNLGPMRTQEEALEVFNEVKADLSEKYHVDIVLDSELAFEPTHAKDKDILTLDTLKDSIQSKVGFLVAGYAITVDGEEIGVFRSEEEAKGLIEKLKEPYLSEFTEEDNLKEINLVEDVQFVKKEVSINSLANEEEVLEYIKNGSEEIKTHTVEVGESFWTIAKIYDTSVDELVLANQDKDPAKLKPGDEVKLLLPTSVITVETVEEIEYTEPVNYETKIEYNDSMYKNQQKVKVEGIKGETKVVANEIRHNGIVVDKEIINEEVLKETVDKVVVQGTKAIPKTVASGTFMMPTRGRISSGYGSRWGRTHKGLDIAASTGTAIKAADAGTVSFAGWKGSYGYMVEIDHGNGYKTRYAHCSKLLVKKGAKVIKGQHIANVGNTGRSTGSHLHFEVLKNGVNQNPAKYVK
ncbi:MAG: peptidoglycan DD-metalloendopeptidase family protein [Tissierellaceae bacterium]|nr:peptidoglycan DD-metalloendopeptidase family protein [Tissierellaceae bacterium]